MFNLSQEEYPSLSWMTSSRGGECALNALVMFLNQASIPVSGEPYLGAGLYHRKDGKKEIHLIMGSGWSPVSLVWVEKRLKQLSLISSWQGFDIVIR